MLIGIDASRAFVGERSGTENYSYAIIRELLQVPALARHQIVLYVRPKASIPDWVKGNGRVRVCELKYRYLWTQVGLALAMWRERPQVLWVPAHTLPLLRPPRLRTVVTIHGLEYQWLPEYKSLLQRWYLPLSTRYAAMSADRLIAVSQSTKRELLAEVDFDAEKIIVIYEGTSANRRIGESAAEEILEKWGLERGKYILFVGTLMPRKNLPSLIEAYSLVRDKLPGYQLVIAGGRGWMTEEIFAAPGRYRVQERVVFAGRVSEEELAALYQGARVYVQPSVTEGFGLPVLEAMQAGVPVVTSSGGALPEVVGAAGLVVELGQGFERRLGEAVVQAATDDRLRVRLVRTGRKRVGKLSWAEAAKKTAQVLINTPD